MSETRFARELAELRSVVDQLEDGPRSPATNSGLRPLFATSIGADGRLYTDLRIGMPHTGRCNLAESPLLKELGHLRWEHIGEVSGVPSRELADDLGERLYATFFFVELAFPEGAPMAAYGENRRVTIVSTLRRYGDLMFDGEHYLCPEGWRVGDSALLSPEHAREVGIPYVRLTNVFVKQMGGADWLKTARPANEGIGRIPNSRSAPIAVGIVARLQSEGSFPEPGDHFTSLGEEQTAEYCVVPDRDLNGVGLLYFANYPRYLDICERAMLATLDSPLPSDLIDARTIQSRQSAYFSNAAADDTLEIRMRCWARNPWLTGCADPESAPVDLHLNYSMHRKSDGRLMLHSTARKTLHEVRLGETPLAAHLKARA